MPTQTTTREKPECRLIGEDGNAFAILGTVRRTLKAAGSSAAELAEFTARATSGDYDNLLAVVQEYVEVV
jgi:hypothetical protein